MSTYTVCPYCGDRMAIGTMKIHLLDCKGQSPPRNGVEYYAQLNRKTKSTSRDATRVLEPASGVKSSSDTGVEMMYSPPPRNPAAKLSVESHPSSVPSSSGETSAPNAQLTEAAGSKKGGTFYRVGVATPVDLTRTSPAPELSVSQKRDPKTVSEKDIKAGSVRGILSLKSASSRDHEHPSSSSYHTMTSSEKPPSIETRTSSKRTESTRPTKDASAEPQGHQTESARRVVSSSASHPSHASVAETGATQHSKKSRLSQAMRGSSTQTERVAVSELPADSYASHSARATTRDDDAAEDSNAALRERIEKLEITCGVVQDVVEQQSEQAAFNMQASERLFAEVQSQCETCQQLHQTAAEARRDLDERVARMENDVHKELQQLRQQHKQMEEGIKQLRATARAPPSPQPQPSTGVSRSDGGIQVLSHSSYAGQYNPNFYADQGQQQPKKAREATAPPAAPPANGMSTSQSVKVSGLNTSTMYEDTPQLSYLNHHNTSSGANSSTSGILNTSIPVSSSIQNTRVAATGSNASPWLELLARRQEAKRRHDATMMTHTPNQSRLDTSQPISIDTIFSKLSGPPSVKAHSPWRIGK